jgi:hypothetical protein
MFLVRSAFWLTVAFMTIHPQSVDVGAAATTLSNQALDAGKSIVVAQVTGAECAPLRCAASDSSAAMPQVAAPPFQVDLDVRNSPSPGPAPYPRPRPSWMG